LNIKGTDIEETPTLGARFDTSYILGMAKTNGGLKILLDIDRALGGEEFPPMDKEALTIIQ